MTGERYVFVHINKTAGSSIESLLGLRFQHKTARELIEELGWSIWNQSIVFSVVRNPWDRVVSQYHYRLKTGQINLATQAVTFGAWVRLVFREKNTQFFDHPKMFMPQFRWLSDDEGDLLVHRICRFETLKEDLSKIPGLSELMHRLPHLKQSEHRHYQTYFDEITKQIVGDYFSEDIRIFEYQF